MEKAYLFCIITTLLFFCSSFAGAQVTSGNATAGWKVILPDEYKCMAARNDYWKNNPDVMNAPLDPVYHYQNGGAGEGRAWNGQLCATSPIWPNNSLCGCADATNWFVNTYTWYHQTTATAFAFWISITPYQANGGAAWHCDYCMGYPLTSTGTATTGTGTASTTAVSTSTSTTGPIFIALPTACQCWQAREKYWNVYPDVRLADIDPVYHYQNSGGSEGRSWDCDLCAVDPITTFNTSCNCNDAAYQFQLTNPHLGATNLSAWNIWIQHYQAGESLAWHAELCIPLLMGILTNSSDEKEVYNLPWSSQCVQAGAIYLTTYPDVARLHIDPAYHYEHSGYFNNWVWDDSPCSESGAVWPNDTFCNCTDAQRDYASTFPTVKVDPAQQFTYWWNTGLPQSGQYWNCSICVNEYLLATRCNASTTCNNNGFCDIGGNCVCSQGFAGTKCDQCAAGYNSYPVCSAEARIRAFSVGISAGLGAVVGVAVVVGLFSAVMLGMFYAAFAKHGSFYSGVIIFGVALSYVAALTQLPRPTDALCTAFPWFLGCAFIFVYGCLFIKTWALYEVWRNATQFKKTNLTPTSILKIIGAALVVEVIFLIIWTVIDPPKSVLKKTVDGDYQHICKCKNMIFWSIFLGVKGAWLIFGAALSVLTRNIAKEYSESKSIAYAIYNDIALLIVAIPLAVLLQNIPGGVLVIEVAVIVLTFTFTMCILFFDIWWGIFFPEKDVIGTHIQSMHKGSGGSGGTASSTAPGTASVSKASHSSAYSASSHSSS